MCWLALVPGIAAGSAPVQDSAALTPAQAETRIGKFEILATYTYARAVRDGLGESAAKERGIVAAVMGARARGLRRGGPRGTGQAPAGDGTAVARKKTLTSETYDQQVAHKLGPFYATVFLPTLNAMVDSGLSYERVKKVVAIPPAIGAKITAGQFTERTVAYRTPGRTALKPGGR